MTLLTEIIELLEQNHNIILHGPGGVGKSYAICHLVDYFRKKKGMYISNTPVTALTGVAAVVLSQSGAKARTLHSWAGIGVGDKSADTLAKIIKDDSKKRSRWKSAWILVIDEISMLSQELFDKLDYIGRVVRETDLPFGGIQLILSGDFLQNPPVKAKFVFTSEKWKHTEFTWIELSIPKRYADLSWFERLLRFRLGSHTTKDWEFLVSRHQAWEDLLKKASEGKVMVLPTVLRPTRASTDEENNKKLDELPGKSTKYISSYYFSPKKGGRINKEYIIKLFEEQIPNKVKLKIGAQVMLRYNIDVDCGLVNGSRGVVTDIGQSGVTVLWTNKLKTVVELHSWSLEDDDGEYLCTQMPLILAWSITYHRSQSATLDSVVLDLSNVFSEGMAYVGLSRVRNEAGLYISSLSVPEKIWASTQALEYLESVENTKEVGIFTDLTLV